MQLSQLFRWQQVPCLETYIYIDFGAFCCFWISVLLLASEMQGRSLIYITFVHTHAMFLVDLRKTKCPEIFSWNSGKKSSSSRHLLTVQTLVLLSDMSRQKFCRRNCACQSLSQRLKQPITCSHRMLCTKMTDAWVNQLITSPSARDENAL